MTTPDRLVADILVAAEGRIVGRIRLQKLFYLLEQSGMRSGLSFHYHNYGPYSRELDDALDRAKALHGVSEITEYRRVDGMPYSIFSVNEHKSKKVDKVGRLQIDKARKLIDEMKKRSSTVLELAATIHWLIEKEKKDDWQKELVYRKGQKTEGGRIEQAVDLLKVLGLSPKIE